MFTLYILNVNRKILVAFPKRSKLLYSEEEFFLLYELVIILKIFFEATEGKYTFLILPKKRLFRSDINISY